MSALLKQFIIAEASRVGSQLDWMATLISRIIINTILTSKKKYFLNDMRTGVLSPATDTIEGFLKSKDMMYGLYIENDLDLEKHQNLFNTLTQFHAKYINVNLSRTSGPISTGGEFAWDRNRIDLKILIPIDIFSLSQLRSQLGDIIPKLKATIRHELQHAQQFRKSYYAFSDYISYPMPNLYGSKISPHTLIRRIRAYCMQYTELDAKVSDIMKYIKSSNKSVNDAINSLLEKISRSIDVQLSMLDYTAAAAVHWKTQEYENETKKYIEEFLNDYETVLRKRIKEKYPKISSI